MIRYLSSLRRQLQEASDLFASRYGKSSNLAEIAIKSLVCVTLLEQELRTTAPGEATEQNASGREVLNTSA